MHTLLNLTRIICMHISAFTLTRSFMHLKEEKRRKKKKKRLSRHPKNRPQLGAEAVDI